MVSPIKGEGCFFLPHPSSPARRFSKIIPRPLLWLRLSPSRSAMFKCICHCTRLIRTFPLKEGAPPLPRPPLLRRGLQPVNRLFCTRKQALTALIFGCARQSIQASLMLCSRLHENSPPSGVFVIIYATELRLFMRLWRPCGMITWLLSDSRMVFTLCKTAHCRAYYASAAPSALR